MNWVLPVSKLYWVAISFSRGSSWSRDWIRVSYTSRWILYYWATREAQGVCKRGQSLGGFWGLHSPPTSCPPPSPSQAHCPRRSMVWSPPGCSLAGRPGVPDVSHQEVSQGGTRPPRLESLLTGVAPSPQAPCWLRGDRCWPGLTISHLEGRARQTLPLEVSGHDCLATAASAPSWSLPCIPKPRTSHWDYF